MLGLAGTLLQEDFVLDIWKAASEITGEVEIEVVQRFFHTMAVNLQRSIRVHIDAIKEIFIDIGDMEDRQDVVFNEDLCDELAVKIFCVHFITPFQFTVIYKQKRPELNKNSGRKILGGFPVLFELFEFELNHI